MELSIADLRFRRLVQHLHLLGPRPLAEFLIDLSRAWPEIDPDIIDSDILDLLMRYERISPAALKVMGGADFPPVPFHVIEPS